MIKLLRLLVLFVGVCVIGAVVIGFLMPRSWSVQRTQETSASPATVAAIVHDLRRWPEWMPWTKAEDPTFVVTFSGPETGVGATLNWNGNLYGQARLVVTQADERELRYDLHFTNVDEPTRGRLRFDPSGTGTRITWSDGGPLGGNPMMRLFSPLMELGLEQRFAQGLTRLAATAEAGR